MKTSDLSAKLLANENITIVRSNSSTAFFDTSTRVLSVPNWKDMTDELETMFISHEVGHALYTTHHEWIDLLNSVDAKIRSAIKGYFNCIEDARIERLMKARYPGLRKTFFSGYKQLMDRDFFRLKTKDINSLIFIDRANIHFKVGYTAGIKFSDEELNYVRRIERAETVAQAFQLALECYEFAKKQKDDILSKIEMDDFGYSDDDEDEDDDEDDFFETQSLDEDGGDDDVSEEDEIVTPKELDTKSFDRNDDTDLESHTDKVLDENLKDLADTSITYVYYNVESKIVYDPIVSYKTVIEETSSSFENKGQELFKSFMKDSERVVNYLVKEFEMRKSATAYKRTKISKSGSLNLNKLHAYSITDDIFKRIMTTPTGKNHGMIFLLDWSGSMSSNLRATVQQLVNLVMFCRRINIPFEVYAFTSEYIRHTANSKSYYETVSSWSSEMSCAKDKNRVYSATCFSLLNFFSSKMTNREFNIMAKRIISLGITYCKGYNLSATPLNDSLLFLLDYVPIFKKSNNVEKLTLVTLSDGCGDNLNAAPYVRDIIYNGSIKTKCKNFVSDQMTGKSYPFRNNSVSYTSILLDMISSRYDVDTVGFFLSSNRASSLSSAYLDNVGERPSEAQLETIKTSMRKDGFYSLPNASYKELFLISDVSTKISSTEDIDVSADDSAASIARAMTKNLTKQRHSRVVLDRFIGHVA